MSIGFNYHNSLKVPTSRFNSIFKTSQTQSLKGYQQMTNLHSMYTQKKGETWQIQKFEYIWNFQFKIKCLCAIVQVQVSMTMILEFKFLSYTTIPPLQTVTYNSKNGIDRWSKRWKERGMNKTHYTAQFSWRKHTIRSLKILSLEQYNE